MDSYSQQYLVTPTADPSAPVQKELSLDQAVGIWGSLFDSDQDKSRPTRPYAQVDLVFNCVSKLIDAVAGIPPVLSYSDETIVESGPAWDFLFNNPNLSWPRILTAAIGHYALSRDVFFVFDNLPGEPPETLQVVSGTQMDPITSDRRASGDLIGWRYRSADGAEVELPLGRVHQWKNFNPYSRFHGLGPATASKVNINYCYAASLFNSTALENGADPGIILMMAGRQDPDTRRMLQENFDARHKGPANAKRTAALSGVTDVKSVAMNMVEMQLAELSQMTGARVCSTFGVPPQMVGLALEAQYSHGPAMNDFIFNTVIPLCQLFAGELTAGLLPRFESKKHRAVAVKNARFYSGHRHLPLDRHKSYRAARTKAALSHRELFVWFDTDQHPVVQAHQQEVAEKMLKLTASGIPVNQIIIAHDLPYDTSAMPWGDHYWIGMGQMPAGWALDMGPDGLTGPSQPEGEPDDPEEDDDKTVDPIIAQLTELALKQNRQIEKNKDEQQNARIWNNWIVSWRQLELEYREAFRKFSLRQQRILIDKLKKTWNQYKSISTKDATDIIARVVFDIKLEDGKLRAFHKTYFETAAELGIRQTITETTDQVEDVLEASVEQTLQSPHLRNRRAISVQKISKVNQTTQNLVTRSLKRGFERGEDLNQMIARISEVTGFNRSRAQRIARTETASAVSTGRHGGMKAAGVELKSWLTSRDPQVRDLHAAAEDRYAAGISIDIPFEVGGEMLMHPADPAGSAANIINCRCLELAQRASGKEIDRALYARTEFYSAQKMSTVKAALTTA